MIVDNSLTEAVEVYNRYLDRMINVVQHLGEDLANDSDQEIRKVLPAVAEGLAWLNEACNNFVNLGAISPELYESYRNIMLSLTEALENKDYMFLQDLCQFELEPLLQELKIKGNAVT
jgi:hypothetical protein